MPCYTLINIKYIIISSRTLFGNGYLISTHLRVKIILFIFIVYCGTPFPRQTSNFRALRLVQLLSFITTSERLMTPRFPLTTRLIGSDILRRINFRVPFCYSTLYLQPFMRIVGPTRRFNRTTLPCGNFSIPRLYTGLAPRLYNFMIILYNALREKISVRSGLVRLFGIQRFTPFGPVITRRYTLYSEIIRVLPLGQTMTLRTFGLLGLLEDPFHTPQRFTILVPCVSL